MSDVIPVPVSSLHIERIVHQPFSVTVDEAVKHFRGLQNAENCRAPARSDTTRQRSAHWNVSIGRDVTDPGRLHDGVAFRFRPASRFLTQVDGTVRLRIAPLVTTRIIFDAFYTPRTGPIGRIFDRVLGRRLNDAVGKRVFRTFETALASRNGSRIATSLRIASPSAKPLNLGVLPGA